MNLKYLPVKDIVLAVALGYHWILSVCVYLFLVITSPIERNNDFHIPVDTCTSPKYRLSRQALRKVTWLSFTSWISCPFYAYEDCIGFCMSLLTIEHSGINARLKPTGPCDGSLISFPLVGRRISVCQTHMAFLPNLYAPNRRCYFLLRSLPQQSALPLLRVTGYSTIHFSFFVKCFNLNAQGALQCHFLYLP